MKILRNSRFTILDTLIAIAAVVLLIYTVHAVNEKTNSLFSKHPIELVR